MIEGVNNPLVLLSAHVAGIGFDFYLAAVVDESDQPQKQLGLIFDWAVGSYTKTWTVAHG